MYTHTHKSPPQSQTTTRYSMCGVNFDTAQGVCTPHMLKLTHYALEHFANITLFIHIYIYRWPEAAQEAASQRTSSLRSNEPSTLANCVMCVVYRCYGIPQLQTKRERPQTQLHTAHAEGANTHENMLIVHVPESVHFVRCGCDFATATALGVN